MTQPDDVFIEGKIADEHKVHDIKDSLLEEKSFLKFEYPTENSKYGIPKVITLPFFEDPEIKESKNAKYAKYQPISRASELFAYLGSEARTFSLTFKLTLPHIEKFYKGTETSRFSHDQLDAKEVDAFFDKVDAYVENNPEYGAHPTPDPELFSLGVTIGGDIAELEPSIMTPSPVLAAASYESAFTPNTTFVPGLYGYPLQSEGYKNWLIKNRVGPNVGSKFQQRVRTKDLLAYWIDIIRSSTYNNVQNPVLGPPIVRITHGILFRNIPCITENYNISFDPNTGYDKNTMLPRVIKVDMELKEIRSGDFGKFNIDADSIESDNLAGWESVIDTPNTLDAITTPVSPGALAEQEAVDQTAAALSALSQNVYQILF